MRDGAPRIWSRPALASAWGVSVSTVSSRLLDYASAGIILREVLGGSQGTRITFLRDPTPDELADRFTETSPAERSPASRAAPKSKPTTRGITLSPAVADREPSPGPIVPEPPAPARERTPTATDRGTTVAVSSGAPADGPGRVLPFRPVAPGGLRTGSAVAVQLASEPEDESVEPQPVVASQFETQSQSESESRPDPAIQETALPPVPVTWSTTLPVGPISGWPAPTYQAADASFADIPEPAPKPIPITLPRPVRLPFFRPSHALRLVSAAAVAVSIAMIAYHSAGSSAASAFHWWATLAMAIILSTGKVVLGSQAEGFFADGEKGAGIFCVIGAVFLLCVDASLLYAFRGDSLSNAAAMEKAAMESRQRVQTRLDALLAEQKRLIAFQADPALVPAAESADAKPIRLVGEVEADLAALEHDRDCRLIQPRARRGEPWPAKVPANEAACEKKRAALQGELARAEDAARNEARTEASIEKREKRLAELPDLIARTEAELGQTQARATPDHGASIVARGLNWVPAGISDVIWGAEMRPVEGRGVEIFWSWAFVLAAEMFAVGGFAVAARADRRARDRRRREALGTV